MSFDPVADAKARNAKLREQLAQGLEERGYLAITLNAKAKHAAVELTRGWGGYLHPKPLCRPHTSRSYAGVRGIQTTPVTCQRCIDSLEARGLVVPAGLQAVPS